MHHIDIIISETSTLPGKVIRFFTKYKYNHASITIDEDFTKFYSFARRKAGSPLDAGFVVENASYFSLGKDSDVDVRVFRIPITKTKLKKLQNLIGKLSNDDEYLYNLFSVVLYPFHLSFSTYKAFYCSEFVAEILKRYTSIKLRKKPSRCSPKDLNNSLNKYLWYEGPVSKLSSIKKSKKDPFFDRVPLRHNLKTSLSLTEKLIVRKIKH